MTMTAAKRAPLAGVRVVDLGQIYSVPFAGAMLADMGAEVIKIEGPDRMDVTRMNGVYARPIRAWIRGTGSPCTTW